MFEVDKVVSTICGKLPDGVTFQPSNINLTDYFVAPTKGEPGDEDQNLVAMDEWEGSVKSTPLIPRYPVESNIIAIDSTSFTLGYVPDGIVGAVRLSVIIKPPGKVVQSLERYGPYLVPITNQNKDAMYKGLLKVVYGQEATSSAPDCLKMLERTRNLLERHIQFEVARNYKESLILLDGSLIGGTVGEPLFFIRKFIDYASGNRNSIVAISKSTGLTLQQSKRNILSLLDGIYGPCYIQGVKNHISQNKDRYLGDIYVARLTSLGEAFRIDIPANTPIPHIEVLTQVAGLAGDYGYPEELKLAHMTCVFSSLEIIEQQSAAISLHGLTLKEELRPKIFPL